MFQWNKLGKVFTPQEVQGCSWLKEFAQGPATLIFDEWVRVYFSCRPAADAQGQYLSYSAYVDLDRADLFKVLRVSEQPIMSLGGLGEFDEFGVYPVSVIRYLNTVRRNLSMKMRHLFFVISVVFPPSQDDLSRPPLAHEEEEVSFL